MAISSFPLASTIQLSGRVLSCVYTKRFSISTQAKTLQTKMEPDQTEHRLKTSRSNNSITKMDQSNNASTSLQLNDQQSTKKSFKLHSMHPSPTQEWLHTQFPWGCVVGRYPVVWWLWRGVGPLGGLTLGRHRTGEGRAQGRKITGSRPVPPPACKNNLQRNPYSAVGPDPARLPI